MPSPAASRVVVTDYTFPSLAREQAAAEAAGAVFEAFQCKSADDVAAVLRGANLAVVQFARCDARAIANLAPGATLLRYGIGYDNIDVEAAAARGIAVGFVPDYCIAEVADHTASLLLSLLRKLSPLDASVRQGRWDAVAVCRPLKPFDMTIVGFFGFGRIAREVRARLAPFGFSFIAADPALSDLEAEGLGVRRVSTEALFREADALSLHAPAVPETIGIVSGDTLRLMQPHAVIVNTARGKLIDDAALAEALRKGRLAGAALDVFETEPLPAESPLRDAPGLLLSPHAAWYSEAAIDRLQQLVAQDIAAVLAGGRPRRPVPESA